MYMPDSASPSGTGWASRRPGRIGRIALGAILALPFNPVPALEGPGLGQPATPLEIAGWNLTVFPDGRGLPEGRGTALEGEPIYRDRCASCHGARGRGGSAEELAGAKHGLTDPAPDKTIGNYWPYATTVFDFTRRSMPLDAPGSLSNDQLYAVTAYLLHLNGLIDEGAEMNATSLAKLAMPNRGGFIAIDAQP